MMRRRTLLGSATAAFVLSFHMPGTARQPTLPPGLLPVEPLEVTQFPPNAFITVDASGGVLIRVGQAEMGQGVLTSCAQLIAEEFECGWRNVRVAIAGHDPVFVNPEFGSQITGASTSTPAMWGHLRTIGAKAREMFIAAGALRLGVAPSECSASEGLVKHIATGRSVRYGQIAAAAMLQPEPRDVVLKTSDQFTVIGKSVARVDSFDKVTGRAVFGIDVKVPNCLVAVIARCPVPGGRVKSFTAEAAAAVKGVKKIVEVPSGIAVVAIGYWAAHKARELLKIEWDEGLAATHSSKLMHQTAMQSLAGSPGRTLRSDGEVEAVLRAPQLDVTYEVPYLAHTPLEPMNCTALVRKESCELWVGTQFATIDCLAAANVLGFKRLDQVKLNGFYLGGGFGRRASPGADFVVEAVQIARLLPGTAVKLMWSREDDLRHGLYRPLFVTRCRANLDANGQPAGLHYATAGTPIAKGLSLEPFMVNNDGIDERSVQGVQQLAYNIPNFKLDLHELPSATPVLWWRSVGHSVHSFVVESFIDEMANAARLDPMTYRLALLSKEPTLRSVLQQVSEMSRWGDRRAKGRAIGVAVHESFRCSAALAAEVSFNEGKLKVEHLWCAVDCGQVINPDIVRQQIEGGLGFGLSSALHEEITVDKGRVQQSNFNDYRLLRLPEMPVIEVHVMTSSGTPRGVGEGVTPLVAPALANAAFRLTGRRARQLPLSRMTWV
jgi:isoquinoline 1-oxidoreductase subunit beta